MNGCIIPGTNIAVDFWKIRELPCSNLFFFLTHLHGDHIVGLTSSWSQPLYCTEISATLLQKQYGLNSKIIQPLEIGQTHLVSKGNATISVTVIDANHCPGAAMYLFEGEFGKILHTGDFRYCPSMFDPGSPLTPYVGQIDTVYLDNTFCNPGCNFPVREVARQEILTIIQDHPEHDIVVGMRKLGKEELLVWLAENLEEWISVSGEMYARAENLGLPNVFQCQDTVCRIRTVPFHTICKKNMKKWNDLRPTIAILPTSIYTGIGGKPFVNQKDVFIVPYSDHSSYSELTEFVSKLKPGSVVPVVSASAKGPFGVSLESRADMSVFDKYCTESKRKVVAHKLMNVICSINIPVQRSKFRKTTSHLFNKRNHVKGVQYESLELDSCVFETCDNVKPATLPEGPVPTECKENIYDSAQNILEVCPESSQTVKKCPVVVNSDQNLTDSQGFDISHLSAGSESALLGDHRTDSVLNEVCLSDKPKLSPEFDSQGRHLSVNSARPGDANSNSNFDSKAGMTVGQASSHRIHAQENCIYSVNTSVDHSFSKCVELEEPCDDSVVLPYCSSDFAVNASDILVGDHVPHVEGVSCLEGSPTGDQKEEELSNDSSDSDILSYDSSDSAKSDDPKADVLQDDSEEPLENNVMSSRRGQEVEEIIDDCIILPNDSSSDVVIVDVETSDSEGYVEETSKNISAEHLSYDSISVGSSDDSNQDDVKNHVKENSEDIEGRETTGNVKSEPSVSLKHVQRSAKFKLACDSSFSKNMHQTNLKSFIQKNVSSKQDGSLEVTHCKDTQSVDPGNRRQTNQNRPDLVCPEDEDGSGKEQTEQCSHPVVVCDKSVNLYDAVGYGPEAESSSGVPKHCSKRYPSTSSSEDGDWLSCSKRRKCLRGQQDISFSLSVKPISSTKFLTPNSPFNVKPLTRLRNSKFTVMS